MTLIKVTDLEVLLDLVLKEAWILLHAFLESGNMLVCLQEARWVRAVVPRRYQVLHQISFMSKHQSKVVVQVKVQC